MLGKLHLLNEWRVMRRHPMIWVALIAITLFSAAVVRGSPVDPGEGADAALLWLNVLFPMFMLPFFAGALAPIFYLREIDHDMTEIVGSYPMTTRAWLTMRVGSFTLLMLFASLLSQLLYVALLLPDHPGEGPTLLANALKWLIVLHVPTCLLWASVLAWVASRKANSGLIYFTAGMLWLGYNGVATLAGSSMIAGSFVPFEPLRQIMLLLDPYAGTTLMGAVPENGLLKSREINLVVGRLFWLGVIFFLLRSIRTVPMLAERKQPKAKVVNGLAPANNGWPSHVGIHLRFVVRDKVFPLLILGWLFALLPETISGMDWVEPFSRVEPDSRDALNRVVWDVVVGAGALLLLYIADRVCRLYSGTRMHELYAATPHRPFWLVTVQLASILLVALFFMVLAGLVVLGAQLALQSPIQPAEYGRQLSLTFIRLAIFGSLYVALHGLIRQRFLANLAGLFVIVCGFSSLLPTMKLYHPLWRPVGTPLAAPDHYWGFGESLSGHWQFVAFWVAVGVALLLAAVARHHRTLPFMQKRLSSTFRHPAMAIAAVASGAAAVQGVSIDRTLRAENALSSPDQRYAWRAAYERGYTHWADVAQPDVEAINTRVDFSPSEQRVRLRADLILLNRTDEMISNVLVGRNQYDAGNTLLTMTNSTVAERDEIAGQTVFALDRPLAPGERATLKVDVTVAQSNLSSPAFPMVLRPGFNSLPAYQLLPFVGFKRELVLRDPINRNEQALPEIAITPPSQLADNTSYPIASDLLMLDTIVTTEAGHYALGQGKLLRQWKEGARSAFHYRTEQPIRAMPAFFSVPWQPQRWTEGATTLQIFGLAKVEDDNSNVLGMRDMFTFLGSQVAPYRGSTLSLLAIPDIGPTGYALPQIVQVSHKFAFRAQPTSDAGFSHVYRRSAHEAAHQWFGHLIGHGVPEDRAFLIESLAKYAELVVIERRFGREAMEALVSYENDRYRQARLDLSARVLPLIDGEEVFDQYSRATLAFACLRQKVGDDAITGALRALVIVSENDGVAVKSRDFVKALVAASPSDEAVIKAMFLGTAPLNDALSSVGCHLKG